jgi:hypothetical protein
VISGGGGSVTADEHADPALALGRPLNDPYLIAIGQILGNVEGRALVWACGLSSLVGAMLLVSLI